MSEESSPDGARPAGQEGAGSGAGTRPPARGAQGALHALLVLAILAVLDLASDIAIPLVLALVLSLILRPMLFFFARHGIPRAVTAIVLVFGLFGALGAGIWVLAGPAMSWADQAPYLVHDIRPKLAGLMRQAEDVQEISDEVEDIASVGDGGDQKVVVDSWSLGGWLLDHAWNIAYTVFFTLVLVYFLLGWGDDTVEAAVGAMASPRRRREVLAVILGVQRQLSLYFLNVTIINAVLGALSGLLFWALDMPNPVLWGAVIALLNFVPYVGPMISAVILTVVALTTYDTLGHALVVPGLFLVLTSIEGQFVTPTVVGRNLTLNPLAIFVGILIWTWLWGIPGALLTVPILMTLRVVADQVPSVRHLGAVLGKDKRAAALED